MGPKQRTIGKKNCKLEVLLWWAQTNPICQGKALAPRVWACNSEQCVSGQFVLTNQPVGQDATLGCRRCRLGMPGWHSIQLRARFEAGASKTAAVSRANGWCGWLLPQGPADGSGRAPIDLSSQQAQQQRWWRRVSSLCW